MNYKSVADLNADIIQGLHLLPQDVDLIVGVPRSGMLAASILATHSHLPLIDVDGFIQSRPAWFGWTKRLSDRNRPELWEKSTDAIRPLLFDDSFCSGKTMDEAMSLLKRAGCHHDFYKGVAYINHENKGCVDFYLQVVNLPRVFEWNLMNHSIMEHSCVDIDGVLCRDPTESENDDSDNYLDFLLNVPARHKPSIEIGRLVTSRLEKYRKQTEQWLKNNNIQYDELIMLDLPSAEERRRQGTHGSFKASVYKDSKARLFVESSYKQSMEIAELSGKPVLCYENGHIVWPDGFRSAWAKQKYKVSHGGWKRCVPAPLRAMYRKSRGRA